MAFVSQEKKKELVPGIKAVLKKYNMKGTISVRNNATLVVKINSGAIDFNLDKGYERVNTYWIERSYEGIVKEFLVELKNAMNVGNWDNSDSQSDYFDVGYYISIEIADYDKPYLLIKE